jgi:hypothetical protein
VVEAVLAPFESVEVREVRERDVEAEQDGEGDDGGADPENTQVDVVQDRAQEEPTKVRNSFNPLSIQIMSSKTIDVKVVRKKRTLLGSTNK